MWESGGEYGTGGPSAGKQTAGKHSAGKHSANTCQGVRERIGWMLRVNRMFGQDERWFRASEFTAAFRGGSWPGGADGSKISRWEKAQLRVPYQAIRRYEELLGQAPGLLAATADNVHAYYCPDPTCPGLDGWTAPRPGGPPVRRIEALLDKIASHGIMTGQEWDEITREISGLPDLFLVPSSNWAVLSERLLQEQIIADRVAWLQRFGSFVRLLSHPVGQESAVAACASLAADRMSQVGIEGISSLDVTAHPDASQHVLNQLAQPTSDKTFYGALLACVRKLARNHFAPGQVRQLAAVVVSLVDDPAQYDEVKVLTASLLRQAPDIVPTAEAQKLRASLGGGERAARFAGVGRLAPADHATRRVQKIVVAATAQMPRESRWIYDEMLDVLVDELLHSPNSDVRLYAAFLIHATPYRDPVAAELGAELTRVAQLQPDLAVCIIDALRLLGGPGQRAIVERLTLNPGVPAAVAVSAARNIGHLGGHSADEYWLTAVGRQQRTGSAEGTAILRGLVYGMGMARNDALLARIRDLGDMPWQARQAASWWLGQPHQIRESATR